MYSGKPPIFEDKEMFRVTIPLLRDEKLDEKDLINLANDTLNLLKINPNMKQKDIAIKLRVSEPTIKRNIKELKEKGYIEREGSKKTGHWKILKND